MNIKIANFAIFFLFFSAVFDPVGYVFYLRYASLIIAYFAIFILYLFNRIKTVEKSYRGILILLFCVILPVYGSCIYFLHGYSGEFIDTSYFVSAILMITSLLYWNKATTEKGLLAFIVVMRLLVFSIISVFISQIFFSADWISFLTENSIALISIREYSGVIFPYVYFLASPMLVFLLSYEFHLFLKSKTWVDLLMFLLSLIALILSGTRAHILIAILFLPIYYMLKGGNNSFIKFLLTISFLGLLGLGFTNIRSILESFFSAKEASNSVKISIFQGYLEIFADPINLFFGQGFNAHEWSAPFRNMIVIEDKASRTELTYLELIRVFGVVIATIVMFLLYKIAKELFFRRHICNWLFVAYLMFLFNTSLNPYLFSVNGILPLCFIVSYLRYNQ